MKECLSNKIKKLVKETFPLEYAKQNMYICYSRSEGNDEVYLVYFDYNYRAPVDMIVYWNGARMLYQLVDMPIEWEPKKSVKDECLKLIDAIEGNIVDMDNRAAARKELPVNARLLRNMIKTMKDKT